MPWEQLPANGPCFRGWGEHPASLPEGPTGLSWLLPAGSALSMASCGPDLLLGSPSPPTPQALSQGLAVRGTFVPWSDLARPHVPPWLLASPRPSLQAAHGPSAQSCAPTPQASGLGLCSPVSTLLTLVTAP